MRDMRSLYGREAMQPLRGFFVRNVRMAALMRRLLVIFFLKGKRMPEFKITEWSVAANYAAEVCEANKRPKVAIKIRELLHWLLQHEAVLQAIGEKEAEVLIINGSLVHFSVRALPIKAYPRLIECSSCGCYAGNQCIRCAGCGGTFMKAPAILRDANGQLWDMSSPMSPEPIP